MRRLLTCALVALGLAAGGCASRDCGYHDHYYGYYGPAYHSHYDGCGCGHAVTYHYY